MTHRSGSGSGSPRREIRVAAAVVASLVLWGSAAAAGSSVVVVPQVEVFAEPSDFAKVVAELGRGASVLVLDEAEYTDVVQRKPGWLAVRLPGSGGIGYVHFEAVGSSLAPAGRPRPQIDPEEPSTAYASGPPRRIPLVAGRFLQPAPARFLLGLGTGAAWFDGQSATQQRIGSSGVTLHATLGLSIYDVFTVSTSGAFIITSDHGSFSEQVVSEQGGNPYTADSSLTVGRYSFAVGLRTPFWALFSTEESWLTGALFADYGWAGVGGSRSISDCTDCPSEDFHLPGGTFWRVGIDLAVPSSSRKITYGFTAAYQSYLEGALLQELQLGLSMWWH